MGKKQRLPKRTKEIALSEHILSSSAIESKQDADLFMVDVKGDENAYKQKRRELNTGGSEASKKKLKIASKQEERKIQQIVKKNKGVPGVPVVEKNGEKSQFDLWDEKPTNMKKLVIQRAVMSHCGISPVVVQTNVPQPKVATRSTTKKQKEANKYTEQNIKKKQIAVDVAHPGQSYKPDAAQHKEAILQAVQIEQKRDNIMKYKNTPLSNGLSQQTLDLLITNSDEESEEEDVDMSSNATMILKKKREKLTRAQRNAQKRHKATQNLHKKNKASKKDLHQFKLLKKIKKGIVSHEDSLEKKRERLEKIRKDKAKIKLGTNVWEKVDSLKVASFPVGLSEEVNKVSASLRSIMPKGSLLVDRAYSMADRGMLNLNKKGNFN